MRRTAAATPFVPIRWRIFSFLFGFGFLAYVQQKSITVAAARMMPELSLSQLQIGYLEQAFVLGYALFQMPGGIFGQRLGARRTFVIIGLTAFLATIATPIAPEFLQRTRPVRGAVRCAAAARLFSGCDLPGVGRSFRGLVPAQPLVLRAGPANHGAGTRRRVDAAAHRESHERVRMAARPAVGGPAGARADRPVGLVRPQYAARTSGRFGAQELAEIGDQPPVHASISVKQMLGLLRNRNVLLLFISYMSMNYTFYLLSNWVFLYLVQERHFSVLESGWLATAPPLAAALGAGVGGLVTGVLTQRFGALWGYRIVPLIALPAAGALLLIALNASNAYWAVATLAMCFGSVELTEGAFWGAAMTVGRGDTMAICGFMNTGGNLGGIISIPIVAYFSGLHSWPTAFVIGVAFAIVSAAAWLGIRIAPPIEADQAPSGR